jgi:hypothetical protein
MKTFIYLIALFFIAVLIFFYYRSNLYNKFGVNNEQITTIDTSNWKETTLRIFHSSDNEKNFSSLKVKHPFDAKISNLIEDNYPYRDGTKSILEIELLPEKAYIRFADGSGPPGGCLNGDEQEVPEKWCGTYPQTSNQTVVIDGNDPVYRFNINDVPQAWENYNLFGYGKKTETEYNPGYLTRYLTLRVDKNLSQSELNLVLQTADQIVKEAKITLK